MATELTTPVEQDPATHQGVTKFTIVVPHKRSADNTDAVIDKTAIFLQYEVTTWNATGKILGVKSRQVPFSDWPAGFKSDVNAVYQKVIQDAKNNGLIGAGTDEPI